MDKLNIYAFVRQQEYLYRSGSTKISKYVQHSLSETVQTIYAYLNSQFISGKFDSLNREKPFFNIVIAARNIWYRATTIQRKDIIIRETDSKHVVGAFLATQKLQEWMRRMRFGVFLTDWGLTLAGFGSAVSKWVRKGNQLIPTVVPWNQIICDTIDFDSNPKIEIFEFTSAQLRQKAEDSGWDMNVVESIINAPMIRMTITQELQDVKPYYHKVYEVHGVFPVSYLTQNTDDQNEYCQQMHVVSYTRAADNGKEMYHDYSLFKGREEKDPYRCDHLIKEDGRTLSIGAVEHLFDSQWMVNHSAKAIKDQLDLASKLIFQSSDPTFTGQNVLTGIETGQILNHKPNEPLEVINNGSHDVGSLQAYMTQWQTLAKEINGITGALSGDTPHAGTAWRLQQMNLTQSEQLFDLMGVNKALAIEDMCREHIIPFIKTELNTTKEIVAVLEAHDIKKIDEMYIPNEAIRRYNKKVIDHVIQTGQMPTHLSVQNEMQEVQSETQKQGNKRYFKPSTIPSKTWKEIFKDLEWEVEVAIPIDQNGTTESTDSSAILSTLNTALQLVMNPGYATNPQAQLIVSKILAQTGRVSPLEISATPIPTPPPQPSPAGATPSAPQPQANPLAAGMIR